MTPTAEQITHPSEDQLGFFGLTPDGSLVLNIPEEATEPGTSVVVPVGYPDFRFPAESVHLGPRKQVRANLEAVRTLRQIQAEGRAASGEEQDVLSRYIGWGPFPGLFVDQHPEWGGLGTELRGLLTPDEWRACEASTPNANHTPGAVIRAVYRMLARLGVDGPVWEGLNALEPGMGTGAFMGHGPAPESGVRWTGVEMEPVAGEMARLLFPSSDVRVTGFEQAVLPANAFDLVVGNVPFGNYPVHDPVWNPRLYSIHNYFIWKSVGLTRPGGIVALITSRYTLDQNDTTVRADLAERADLLAAVRLPDSAFRGRAVQRVTTDLLILRRREAGQAPSGPAWLETVEVETPDGPALVNEYFAARPEMMAGSLRLTGKNQYRTADPAVVLPPSSSLDAELERITALLPEDVYTPRDAAQTFDFRDAELAAGLADGAYKVIRGRLRRWLGGRWVFHGLKADKTQRDVYRVVSLCAIRDAQREVLRTQAQDCPEEEQAAARAELNRLYDAFVRMWGPINREKRVEDANGIISIRRPNLEAFRGDPYAMNVAALEHYDAETHTVRKAAIFTQRVVRPLVIPDRASTAEEALLLTLDRAGRVDLGLMAGLWGRTEEEVAAELEGRIFLNPGSGRWETDDEYLSGRVRRKLREAREAAEKDPRFRINVHALEMVQPEDVGPSNIALGLGATWIGRAVYVQFIRDLLDLPAGSDVQLANVDKEALWALRASKRVRDAVRARSLWGTPRASAFRLIEDLLNQRATVIYDTIKEKGKETTVRNVAATDDAQEKGQQIAEEFVRWAWADADRAEYLVRRYNECFNDVRLREYDGSHMSFPGLSAALVPEPHQRNVAWEIVSHGSTGMAHAVGAGKTLAAILASMRLRQLGLCSKPLHATMGHMLEQYSREFLQAYPQARLLTAHVEDVSSKDRRRLFFARAASGDYDAIIVTHSAFEKLGMSADFERTFLESEVDAFRKLHAEAEKEEGKRSLTVKQLQVVLRQYEARLESLGHRSDRDENLTFEELGIDWLFVDEIHLYKNAATRTKIVGMPRAAKPSKRSSDLWMKSAYMHGRRPGRAVVGMTGTLIANTIAELHVHLRYLAPDLLREYGIEHFDAFAANFIRRTWALEPSPSGAGFAMRERFHFTNVPELLAIISQRVDIQIAESLYAPPAENGDDAAEAAPEAPSVPAPAPTLSPPSMAGTSSWPRIRVRERGPKQVLKLPRPALFGGRPEVATAEPSDELLAYTATLVERAAAIRDPSKKIDPRVDNMLKVTTDGRKAALDMRLIDPSTPDYPGSKVNLLVEDVFRRWDETRSARATQLIFCDLSVPRYDGGFSIYNDIRDKLLARGVPQAEIAFMQEATNPRKKAALQAAIRAGRVRIVLGSTFNMGTGTNVQDLIIAIHHLDAPYRPSDVEQRDGRGARRGNLNPVIWIRRYVTERSFDAYIWNLLHYKLEMINRVMMGDPSIREIADNDSIVLSYAEVKALAAGNPLILERANIEAEIARMRRARSAFLDRQIRARGERADYPRRLAAAEDGLASARADVERRQDTHGDAFRLVIGDREYRTRPEAGKALRQAMEEGCHRARRRETIPVGKFAGFDLFAVVHPQAETALLLRGARDYEQDVQLFQSPVHLVLSLEAMPRRLDAIIPSLEQQVAYLRTQVAHLEALKEEPFPQEAKLLGLVERLREIERSLRIDDGGQRQTMGSLDVATAEEEPDEDPEIAVAA
jgi:N12 class adenine-specific DNA methylase